MAKIKPEKGAQETGEAPAGPDVDVTPGEVVHYTTADERPPAEKGKEPLPPFKPEIHAALVTEVNGDGTVQLLVHGPIYDYRKAVVRFTGDTAGSEAASGKWTFRTGAHV